MVRNYKKKTERQVTTPRKLNAVIKLVENGWSIRKAAETNSVCSETLRLAYTKLKETPVTDVTTVKIQLTHKSRNIFPAVLEDELADYCIEVAQRGYGLSVKQAKELAYDLADKNRDNIKMPAQWDKNKIAGDDWFQGFRKRHPNISIRVPEACSVARAMAFNETNVNTFFDKLSEVRDRHPSFQDGTRVYNLDETNTSTVQNVRKILSPKGVRQIHQVKGAERGESVTTCVIIGAHGTVLPPVHIFPRKKFNRDFLINAYPGAVGMANAKGYMTKETFLEVMQHFIKVTGSSKENPTLLLLDNVDSHFSTETLDLAKSSGVVVFTFPPHCTHKLQPLDVGFFGPFKTYYDQAVSTYLANNPASPPTIYRIARFVRDALGRAASPQTIIKSFEAPGIVPFNRNIFTEADFIMARVTSKPNPSENNTQPNTPVQPSVPAPDLNSSSPAKDAEESFVGPMQIRGLPKAKDDGKKKKPRRNGKCMVATDTPEKEEIGKRQEEITNKKKAAEERKTAREEKAHEERKRKRGGKQSEKGKKNSIKTKRALDFESDGSEEADDVCGEHCDENVITTQTEPNNVLPSTKIGEGDYVLVEFRAVKVSPVFYVGKILTDIDSDGDHQVTYYRKKVSRDNLVSFTLPPIPDLKTVSKKDIKILLPKPISAAVTRRQQDIVSFDFDFSTLKLC